MMQVILEHIQQKGPKDKEGLRALNERVYVLQPACRDTRVRNSCVKNLPTRA